LPLGTEQSSERCLRLDKGAAQWAVEVAQTSRTHHTTAEYHSERRLGDHHRRYCRSTSRRIDTCSAGCSAQPACCPDRLHPEASSRGEGCGDQGEPTAVPGPWSRPEQPGHFD